MEKKIGQIIKEVVETKNYRVSVLAKKINLSRNNIYDIYERSSIDTDLLKKIGHVLEYDFFQHLISSETINKIKISENLETSKVLVEIQLSRDEMVKIGFEEKVLKVLNRSKRNESEIEDA